jgi:hypothetical protein
MLYVIVRYVLDVLEPPKVEILRTFRNIQLYIWLYIQLYIQPFFTSYIQRKRSRRNLGHFNLSFFCCNRTNDVTYCSIVWTLSRWHKSRTLNCTVLRVCPQPVVWHTLCGNDSTTSTGNYSREFFESRVYSIPDYSIPGFLILYLVPESYIHVLVSLRLGTMCQVLHGLSPQFQQWIHDFARNRL